MVKKMHWSSSHPKLKTTYLAKYISIWLNCVFQTAELDCPMSRESQFFTIGKISHKQISALFGTRQNFDVRRVALYTDLRIFA